MIQVYGKSVTSCTVPQKNRKAYHPQFFDFLSYKSTTNHSSGVWP